MKSGLPTIFLFLFQSCVVTTNDKVFKDGSSLTQLFDGGKGSFLEGPVMSPNGLLYFTFMTQEDKGGIVSYIMQFDPNVSEVKRFKTSQGIFNGLAFDKNGNLIACDPKKHEIIRFNLPSGQEEIVATHFNNRPFDEPNDIVADLSGNVYFSDPIFFAKDTIYQSTRGIYQVDTGGGVKLIVSNAQNPNGLILSPDQRTLYVADSPFNPESTIQKGGAILVYQKQDNGEFIFMHELVKFNGDGPDGMAIDKIGNIYVALFDSFKIVVFTKTGEKIDELQLPDIHPTNLAFGRGVYRNTLYITTENGLYSIMTNKEGFDIP